VSQKKPKKARAVEGDERAPSVAIERRWVLALLVVLGCLIALFVGDRVTAQKTFSADPGYVEFRVPAQQDGSELYATLERQGIVLDGIGRGWASLHGMRAEVGEHYLPKNASLAELVRRLGRNGSKAKVVLPEGYASFDMGRKFAAAGICSKAGFLRAVKDTALLSELQLSEPSFEGYLFPATYELPQNSDAREVVRRLKQEFDKRYETLRATAPASRPEANFSKRDWVILASLIEKEAVVDDERAMIASVFYNRLLRADFTPKLLQSDPSAVYGCAVVKESPTETNTPAPELPPGCAKFTGKATHDVVHDVKNPYSTYTHEGLPPGPIANPGARSLAAAMGPAESGYLYFVARGEGRHVFTETYKDHMEAIKAQKAHRP
jgi:UPF0755 protein